MLAAITMLAFLDAQPEAAPLPPPDPPVERHGEWDGLFTRTRGWNAGDGAYSIDLGDRTLWLFGDSIIGPVRDGSRIGGESRMVRGAIAWHDTPEPGEIPEQVTFAIGELLDHLEHAPWINPEPGLWEGDAWYWLMGDGERVTTADGADRFVLFATAIGPAGAPEGIWNFRQIGGVIFEVENPAESPADWRATQKRNPLVSEFAKHGEEFRTGENWGLAVLAWKGEERDARDRTLYIYGVRSDAPARNELLIARCAEPDLAHPDRWRFFDGERWSDDPAEAAPIADGLVSEFTVEAIEVGGEPLLVLIQSEPMLGRHVLARTARKPWGPWSAPKRLHEVREVALDDRLMTYAAKGHARLSRPGELLITYLINSRDFGQIFRDASLYRPRFLRVPLEMLPPARD